MIRYGYAVLDLVISFAVLAVALVLAAQLGVWSLSERTRNAARQEAVETAANVMESARALPGEELTPEWAAKQKLPEALAARLYDGKLTVRVEPEASRPHVKRVTVEVAWKQSNDVPARPVRLVGLFSERSGAGGEP
jgi:type II secretory pathway pseudopilin PulG